MKKALIGILVICLVTLSIVTGNLYRKIQNKENQLVAQEEKMKELQTQKTTAEDENLNSDSKNLNVKFDENKMKLKAKDVIYESTEYGVDSNYDITISLLENNKLKLYTNPESETYQMIFPNGTKESNDQEITGFDGNVVDVFYTCFGQEAVAPKILFLMEDGTVEYIDSSEMIKNKNYKSAGKIEELSNIVRFAIVSVGFLDDEGNRAGGELTTVAIDKDGYAYDLGEIEILRKK